MYNILIGISAATLYLFATAVLLWGLASKPAKVIDKKIFYSIGLTAIILHGYTVAQNLFSAYGLNLSFFHAGSLLGWLLAVLLLLATFRAPVATLGVAVFPIAALAIVFNAAFPQQHVVLENPGFGLDVHILISILTFSFLNIAALQALLLAMQDRSLRNKHPTGFIRALPPLETMETLLFQIIGIGFILETISLITGVLYLDNMFAQHMVHKTILSIVAWLVFAVLLMGRWKFGWRGQTAIHWTLSGFIALVLAYFGSKLVLELLLKR